VRRHDQALRDEEVRRIMALGATIVDDRRKPDGTGWVVHADPEGNEFCVECGVPGDG
jgi:predicted enzyme related to lactoylglutathione lyase